VSTISKELLLKLLGFKGFQCQTISKNLDYNCRALPWLEGALPEILCGPGGPQRGFGNSFQPAIDAPRYYLMSCVIAPSAKMSWSISPQPTFIHRWRRAFANIGDVVLNGTDLLLLLSAGLDLQRQVELPIWGFPLVFYALLIMGLVAKPRFTWGFNNDFRDFREYKG